jgi:hypothetical protein
MRYNGYSSVLLLLRPCLLSFLRDFSADDTLLVLWMDAIADPFVAVISCRAAFFALAASVPLVISRGSLAALSALPAVVCAVVRFIAGGAAKAAFAAVPCMGLIACAAAAGTLAAIPRMHPNQTLQVHTPFFLCSLPNVESDRRK